MTTAVAMQLNLFTRLPEPGRVALVSVPEDRTPATPAAARSRAAREHHAEEHGGRKQLILDCLRLANKPMTDRQIKEKLFGVAADMNMVRPRVNDLLRERRLYEGVETPDHVTGEWVRTVWLA